MVFKAYKETEYLRIGKMAYNLPRLPINPEHGETSNCIGLIWWSYSGFSIKPVLEWWWWCSNLHTYGKSLSFSTCSLLFSVLCFFCFSLSRGEGKMNFPNVLFYMRNLTFFSIHFDCFFVRIQCLLVWVVWDDGMMIVILVSGSQLKESLSRWSTLKWRLLTHQKE